MKQSIDEFKNVLIVGNGFDLNMGYKTSYSNYLDSHYFKELLNNNLLAQYLDKCLKESKWVDIEKELYKYSTGLFYKTEEGRFGKIPQKTRQIESLKEDYKRLCYSLRGYLNHAINVEIKFNNNAAYRVLSEVLRSDINTYILTFNYTDIIERLRNIYFQNCNKYCINHIHGSLSNNIVFGIEDSVEVAKEHVFLYKSHNINQNINGLISVFENAKNITFFGYSLGETDHSYFDDFFKAQTMPDCKDKNFTFYYYGDNAYDDLIWQLKKLTNNRLSYLKQFNKLNFIDVK